MTSLNHLRLGFVGLAAVLALTLGWNLARNTPNLPSNSNSRRIEPSAASIGERFARERAFMASRLTAAPDYAEFARKYSTSYPSEWGSLLDRLAQRRIAGEPLETPDATFIEALRDLRRSRGVVAAKASAPALSRIFETQAAMLAALSVLDRRLCVDFLFGQPSQGILDLAARHPGLTARIANAAIDAILDGNANNISRGAPTDSDFDLLEAGLRSNGLSKPEIEVFLDGRHPDPPLPDERLCEAGITYLDVMKRLPEEPRLRLYALAVELMGRM